MYNKEEIFGFETDTVWGIGAHPLCEKAVKKMYIIKGRAEAKPLILMSNKIEYLLPYVESVPKYAMELIKTHFPGGLTLIFKKTEKCPDYITSKKDTIGIRIPNHKGFCDLTENIEGKVLATTSLNYSGFPPVKNYEEAILKFGEKINVIKPKTAFIQDGTASTVVLCTGSVPVILRQGNVVI
ncbi:MAG: threonylcarbamoyl-AMP synthase [Candidatus Gastranaerophilales bacterium]|nr:threonylcarbamoyl-AMP synthase [Candidatus Gastranaerophilales bacterium]